MRIGGGLVRVVAAALVFEVAAIAAIVAAVFAYKAFVTGPSLDECAVNAEVLAGEQAFVPGLLQHQIEELDDGVMLDQTLAILGEDGRYPNGIVHGQANEPAKQQVVLGLLHELALGADAVKHLQEHGAQELLRRDAGATAFDVGLVHAAEKRIHLHQRGVNHLADGPQGMLGRNEVLQLLHGEQALGEGVGSAHFFGSGLDQ